MSSQNLSSSAPSLDSTNSNEQTTDSAIPNTQTITEDIPMEEQQQPLIPERPTTAQPDSNSGSAPLQTHSSLTNNENDMDSAEHNAAISNQPNEKTIHSIPHHTIPSSTNTDNERIIIKFGGDVDESRNGGSTDTVTAGNISIAIKEPSVIPSSLQQTLSKEEQDLYLLRRVISRFPRLPLQQRRDFLIDLVMSCDPWDNRFLLARLPRLHRDFLALLPVKIANQILLYARPKDFVSISQVADAWRQLFTASEEAWKNYYGQLGLHKSQVVSRYYDPQHIVCRNAQSLHKFRQWALGDFEHKVIQAHYHGGILGMTYDSANKLLATAGADKTCKVFDLKTGKMLNMFSGHEKVVQCIQIGHGIVVSGSADYTVKIWSLETGECLNTLEGHTAVVTCMKLISNDLLVTASTDKTLKIWSLNSRTLPANEHILPWPHVVDCEAACLRTLYGHSAGIKCLDVSENIIISGDVHGKLRIWHLQSGNCLREAVLTNGEPIYSLQYTAPYLALGSIPGKIYLYKVQNWDESLIFSQTPTENDKLRGLETIQIVDGQVPLGVVFERLREWAVHADTFILQDVYDLRQSVSSKSKQSASMKSRDMYTFIDDDDEDEDKDDFDDAGDVDAPSLGVWALCLMIDDWRIVASGSQGIVCAWNHTNKRMMYSMKNELVDTPFHGTKVLPHDYFRVPTMEDIESITGSLMNLTTSSRPSMAGGGPLPLIPDRPSDVDSVVAKNKLESVRTVTGIAFDDDYIVAVCVDGKIRVWENLTTIKPSI